MSVNLPTGCSQEEQGKKRNTLRRATLHSQKDKRMCSVKHVHMRARSFLSKLGSIVNRSIGSKVARIVTRSKY